MKNASPGPCLKRTNGNVAVCRRFGQPRAIPSIRSTAGPVAATEIAADEIDLNGLLQTMCYPQALLSPTLRCRASSID